MTTPREAAVAVSAFLGTEEGGRSEEALARLLHKGGKSGYSSLTQADFDAVQDAYDDSTGQPRRKKQNPIVWKIQHWWYWRILNPVRGAANDVGTWARRVILGRTHIATVNRGGDVTEHDCDRLDARRIVRQAAADGARIEKPRTAGGTYQLIIIYCD